LAKTISADEVQTKSSHINLQIRGNLKFYFTTYFLVYSFFFWLAVGGTESFYSHFFGIVWLLFYLSSTNCRWHTLHLSV